mgnify:FL=1
MVAFPAGCGCGRENGGAVHTGRISGKGVAFFMDDIRQARKVLTDVVENVGKAIIGKRRTIELVVLAMASGGHVLIEDIPGVGKTSLACALARSVDCEFKRIQFTPDILPSDITGFSIYNSGTGKFEYRPGPVMSNFVLADEINRTSPKTQASLLEIMEEGNVTVDGVSHPLPQPFMILATQNPIEYQGTYPLPEAEIDRFTIRVSLGYPETEDELWILYNSHCNQAANLSAVASAGDVLMVRKKVLSVHVSEEVGRYILAVVGATRTGGEFALGASPRASIMLFQMSQALALYRGREFVIPDDVKFLAPFVLCHRLLPSRGTKASGGKVSEIVNGILASTPAPSLRA